MQSKCACKHLYSMSLASCKCIATTSIALVVHYISYVILLLQDQDICFIETYINSLV